LRGGLQRGEVMEKKCGCYSKVFIETIAEKIETFRVEIFYCPLHAAAPLMLEALKMVEWKRGEIYEICPWCYGVRDVFGHDPDCPRQAAIAAAEPEEHNG